jgi:hypothetical protein
MIRKGDRDMQGKVKILASMVSLSLIASVVMLTAWVGMADSADKPPVTRYWMSVSTEKGGFPGMTPGSMGPGALLGSLFGKGGDSGKRLLLQVNSPKALPDDPQGTHDIPPGQNMGQTLPLLTPEPSRDRSEPEGRPEKKVEKPKMRLVVYWGCSETVKPGQPYVVDTEKTSLAEFGRVFQGRYVSSQNPPSPQTGRVYADWPNKKDSTRVPADSSLVGNHFVHGNYVPDIRFSIDARHDFMAPVEFTSKKGSPAESFFFQWNAIPTATGYFAMAMGHEEKTGTMIIWTSSDVRETGGSLMNFLPNEDVRRLVGEKVVMPPSATQCVVPKGIFKDAHGAMIQFIAYGDELNVGYPPKPKDLIWTAKVRRKSTSMLPLMDMGGRGSSDRDSRDEGETSSEKKEGFTPGKVFKGLFGR